MTISDKLLTVQRVAQFLAVSEDTVRNLCHKGEIRATKVGAQLRIFWTSDDPTKPPGLKEYLAAQEQV